jgi:hypothetical protein
MSGSATLARLLRGAREDRCLLREKWTQGAELAGREQLRLARELAKITPAKVERHGRRVPCEARFELRPKDRRRLVEALLADGVSDGEILATVPGLTARTFRRIRSNTLPSKTGSANGFPERRIRPKRENAVDGPWTAFLDATSGADAAAERRFRELVGGTA